jgi:hypothetical protein
MKNITMDINSIIKKFSTMPLKGDELDEEKGFYVDTIAARTGNSFESPIDDIFNDCTTENVNFIHLLLGHRGCGKRTEINKLEKRIVADGFTVRKFDLQAEANLSTLTVQDILILISNALLDICNEKRIDINQSDVEKLNFFFSIPLKQSLEREPVLVFLKTML